MVLQSMEYHLNHTLPKKPPQTRERITARRQNIPCPRPEKTGATVSQAKRRRTQQRLAQRLLWFRAAADKRPRERNHTRHTMHNGLIHHRHSSPQTPQTRPNTLTNHTPPNIHTKSITAIASRAKPVLTHIPRYLIAAEKD